MIAKNGRTDVEDYVTKGNITFLEARVGGFHEPPIYVSVDVSNNTVTYSNGSEWTFSNIVLQVSTRKMNRFLKGLKKCHLFDWSIEYPNYLGIIDGTRWDVSYLVDGTTVVKSGDNHFPEEWEKFCKAVSKLSGKNFG